MLFTDFLSCCIVKFRLFKLTLVHISLAYTVAVSSVDVDVIRLASKGISPFNHVFVTKPDVRGNPIIDSDAMTKIVTRSHSGTLVGETCSEFFLLSFSFGEDSVENRSVLHKPCCIAYTHAYDGDNMARPNWDTELQPNALPSSLSNTAYNAAIIALSTPITTIEFPIGSILSLNLAIGATPAQVTQPDSIAAV